MKKLAIALSIFPGILFVGALLSYVISSIAERNLPPGGVDIGLSLLLLAALVNLPTVVIWIIVIARRRSGPVKTQRDGTPEHGKEWISVAIYVSAAVVVGALSCTAISAYARAQDAADARRVTSLEEWEKRTRQPGFTQLHSADLPDYYLCVYDTGLGEIAFCYHEKKPGSEDMHSFAVYDSGGQNLQDPARWNSHSELNRPGDTSFIAGMVVPIRPDHRGPVEIDFKADNGSGFRSVYRKRLPLDLINRPVGPSPNPEPSR